MINTSLFEKYRKLEVISNGTLFNIDWTWVRKENRCPLCLCKLYDSVKYPDSIICRSKRHKFFKIKKWQSTGYPQKQLA